jgi:hypothetical protein
MGEASVAIEIRGEAVLPSPGCLGRVVGRDTFSLDVTTDSRETSQLEILFMGPEHRSRISYSTEMDNRQ